MPTVPIIDSPTVSPEVGGPQPFVAPGVEPVRNFQPEQGAKLGAATQAAGQTMIKIGDMLQDQIDDANTKAADSWYTSQAQKVLFDPKEGYLNSIGIKAKDGYLPTQEKLTKLRQDAEVALTNDVQKRMFAQVAAKHEINFSSQMDVHAVKQIRVYAAGESEARQKQYTDLAIADPVGRQSYIATAVQEANDRADLFQLPADSAQRKQIVMGAYQDVHIGVANDMMLNNKFGEAKGYLDKAFKDQQMDGKTYQTLSKQVDAGYRKQKAVTLGDAIFKSGQALDQVDPSSVIDYVINKHEGGYVANDAGKGPTKYGINGKANGLTDKQVENLTLDQARDIYRKNYWDKIDADNLDPSIRAMAFDTAVNQGVGVAQKLIKESGGDVAKFAQLRKEEYAALVKKNPEKYGQYEKGWMNRVDDFVASAEGKSQSLSAMLARTDDIPDIEDREMTRSRIKSQWAEKEAVTTQDYQQKVLKAQDIAFSKEGGWVDVPPQLWGDLKQSDKAAIMNRPKTSDSNTLLNLQQNPELWAPGKIEKFRPLLSESDYRQFVAKGSGADGSAKILAASIDQEQMKNQLLNAGLDDLVNPKKDSSDEKERIRLNARFEQEINQEQISKKRQLSMDEKNALLVKILKPVKVNMVYTNSLNPMTWIGKGETTGDKRVYQVENRSNIVVPQDERAQIIFDLNKRGLPVTNDTILNGYLAKKEIK
jgi:lysozyme family protein